MIFYWKSNVTLKHTNTANSIQSHTYAHSPYEWMPYISKWPLLCMIIWWSLSSHAYDHYYKYDPNIFMIVGLLCVVFDLFKYRYHCESVECMSKCNSWCCCCYYCTVRQMSSYSYNNNMRVIKSSFLQIVSSFFHSDNCIISRNLWLMVDEIYLFLHQF